MPENLFHLTYLDWSLQRQRPAVLDERDIIDLRHSTCLFARKFDKKHSAALIRMLGKEINGP